MIFHIYVPCGSCLLTFLFVAPNSNLRLDMAPYKCILLLFMISAFDFKYYQILLKYVFDSLF